ncbi:unnamed protein product [Pedinophyceae sp. YPF-701]|nr:unnamed protein product [Pedinophyceae sp. YPF-701]
MDEGEGGAAYSLALSVAESTFLDSAGPLRPSNGASRPSKGAGHDGQPTASGSPDSDSQLRDATSRMWKLESELAEARDRISALTGERDELKESLRAAEARARQQEERAEAAEASLAEANEQLKAWGDEGWGEEGWDTEGWGMLGWGGYEALDPASQHYFREQFDGYMGQGEDVAMQHLVEACGGDVEAATHLFRNLTVHDGARGDGTSGDAGAQPAPPPADSEHFPALGGASNGTHAARAGADGGKKPVVKVVGKKRVIDLSGVVPANSGPPPGVQFPHEIGDERHRARNGGGHIGAQWTTERIAGAGSEAYAGAGVRWTPTGEAVSELYGDARTRASEHARARNQCFMQATIAYQNGDGKLARDLGAQGRWHAERMAEAHHAASQAIYGQRNGAFARGGEQVIDLHGQHVAEAQRILDGALQRGSGTWRILVGTGHHTVGSKTPARLPAAVEEHLRAMGFSPRAAAPGVISVDC